MNTFAAKVERMDSFLIGHLTAWLKSRFPVESEREQAARAMGRYLYSLSDEGFEKVIGEGWPVVLQLSTRGY